MSLDLNPGPWKVSPYTPYTADGGVTSYYSFTIRDSQHYNVADVCSFEDNAKLIAAAPDLLQTVKDLVRILKPLKPMFFDGMTLERAEKLLQRLEEGT